MPRNRALPAVEMLVEVDMVSVLQDRRHSSRLWLRHGFRPEQPFQQFACLLVEQTFPLIHLPFEEVLYGATEDLLGQIAEHGG